MSRPTSRPLAAALAAALCAALVSCSQGAREETGATVSQGRSTAMFTVTSSAFTDGACIPKEYASARAGGEDRSLPLEWSGAPAGTRSYAVAIVDHAPVANMWVHWAVAGIPVETTSLSAGASRTPSMPAGAREYRNTSGSSGYAGPAPPPGSGDHDYVVTVYALSAPVEMPPQPSASDIDEAVGGKVLDTAEITALYSR